MKNQENMRKLIVKTVFPTDRVTFISELLPSSNIPTIVSTKLDLMQPSLVGTWTHLHYAWDLNTTEIFPPFRGLFGKEFIIASLPVSKNKKYISNNIIVR